MTLFAYLNGSDHAHEVRLGEFGLTTRADGSLGSGNIVFDDPDGDLDIRGWMHCVVKESACTTAPVIYAGYVYDRRYSRSGPESTYHDGAARFIDTSLVDLNTLLHFQAMFAAEANRPAETEEDRVNWLLGSQYVQGVIDDGKSNPTTRMLEAEDYRQQYPDDVLSSLVNTWVYFVYLTQPDGDPALYFNPASSSTGTSTLSISNDLSDITLTANGEVTGTCFPSSIDAEMTMDPSEVYARIGLYWVGGRTIRSDSATLAYYFTPSGLGWRSLPYTTDRVKTEATAIAYADRMLARDSTENETITDTIIVPAAQVGLVQAGNRIDTKYLHFGDSDFVSRRISGLEVHQYPGRRDLYLVSLEMNAKGSDAIGGGGGGPGDFPHPPPAVGAIVQQVSGSGNIQMPNPIGDGNTLIFAGTCRNAAMSGTWIVDGGYTECPDGQSNDPGGTNTAVVVYKLASSDSQYIGGIVGATNITTETTGTWYEIAGTWTPDTHDERAAASTTVSTPSIAVAANSMTFAVVGQGQGGAYDSVAATLTFTTAAPFVEDQDVECPAGGHPNTLNAHYIASGAGSVALGAVNSGNVGLSGTDYNYIAQIVSFTTTDLGETQPPAPGQWVGPETVTMSGADGTTIYPFADGSLQVFHDGFDQTIHIASYDGAAGTFTLDYTPDIGSTITVRYQGR